MSATSSILATRATFVQLNAELDELSAKIEANIAERHAAVEALIADDTLSVEERSAKFDATIQHHREVGAALFAQMDEAIIAAARVSGLA